MLCAHPTTFMSGASTVQDFLKDYFVIDEATSSVMISKSITTPATFPNTMTTISEVDHVPMDEVFRRILSNTLFDWAGILAFFGLLLLRLRVLLPLAPMLALALLSFHSSNRFIMYLAPFIGIGLGWLLQLGVEGAFYVLTQRDKDAKKAHRSSEKTNHSDVKVVTQRGKNTKGLKKTIPRNGVQGYCAYKS